MISLRDVVGGFDLYPVHLGGSIFIDSLLCATLDHIRMGAGASAINVAEAMEQGASKEDAEKAKEALEAAGATIELK